MPSLRVLEVTKGAMSDDARLVYESQLRITVKVMTLIQEAPPSIWCPMVLLHEGGFCWTRIFLIGMRILRITTEVGYCMTTVYYGKATLSSQYYDAQSHVHICMHAVNPFAGCQSSVSNFCTGQTGIDTIAVCQLLLKELCAFCGVELAVSWLLGASQTLPCTQKWVAANR
jgi:hypothetical protein